SPDWDVKFYSLNEPKPPESTTARQRLLASKPFEEGKFLDGMDGDDVIVNDRRRRRCLPLETPARANHHGSIDEYRPVAGQCPRPARTSATGKCCHSRGPSDDPKTCRGRRQCPIDAGGESSFGSIGPITASSGRRLKYNSIRIFRPLEGNSLIQALV